jgi:NitT/TauT family transport system permease protein
MTVTTKIPASTSGRERRRSQTKVGAGRLLAMQLGAIAVLLLIWQAISLTGVLSPQLLPSVPSVVESLISLLGTSVYWSAVGSTLLGALKGLVVAFLIGVPLGLVTGTYSYAERATRPTVDFGRSFPIVALLPIFLLLFGATSTMESIVVFLACVFPLFLQAQYGARGVPAMIRETARSYRIHGLLRFYKVILPSAIPSIMTGLRLATAASVLVAVGVEILTAVPGLGGQISEAQLGGDAAQTFAYIFTAGLLGFSINRVCEVAEAYFLRWRPPTSGN